MIARARTILSELNPEIPPRFRTLEEIVSTSVADRRFNLLVLGAFAGSALLLSLMGIYGVTTYAVTQRTREIGVRAAFGAQPYDVLRLIIGQGSTVVLIGLGFGIVGALGLTRVLRNLLFGVTSYDPITFLGVSLLLVGTALLACYIPARRATKVDPMIALRYE